MEGLRNTLYMYELLSSPLQGKGKTPLLNVAVSFSSFIAVRYQTSSIHHLHLLWKLNVLIAKANVTAKNKQKPTTTMPATPK